MRGNQLGAPMTQQQTAVLDFVRRFMQTEGLPPTRAEVARGMGFRSANAAEEHLQALARRGVIRLTRGRSRGITILNG